MAAETILLAEHEWAAGSSEPVVVGGYCRGIVPVPPRNHLQLVTVIGPYPAPVQTKPTGKAQRKGGRGAGGTR